MFYIAINTDYVECVEQISIKLILMYYAIVKLVKQNTILTMLPSVQVLLYSVVARVA